MSLWRFVETGYTRFPEGEEPPGRMESAATSTRFESEIAQYHRWREDLTQSVHAYHDWLESNGHLDVQQSIRFYDLLENLNKGRLMLAFLAEFSRSSTPFSSRTSRSGCCPPTSAAPPCARRRSSTTRRKSRT